MSDSNGEGMRSKTKILLFLLLLPLLAIDSFGQQKAGDIKLEDRVFTAAKGDKVDAEYGRLYVPENRSKKDSRLIEVAFVKFKSTAQFPRPPIIYLAGGPGGSGIGAARGPRFPLFMAMREMGDVIALDQRGTGDSLPNVACTETVTLPSATAVTRAAAVEQFRNLSRKCSAKLRDEGVDLSGYNTNESADDIDDLRKALRFEKVSLWAISYGTHLALATIKRHENRIHRAILAGTESLPNTLKLPSDTEKHLQHLDQMVKTDAELSKKIPSLLALIKEVLEMVDREPVTVEVTDPKSKQKTRVVLNKFALQMVTAYAFGSGETFIPASYYAMSKGDFSSAAGRWLAIIGGTQSIGSGMSNMMDCYSGVSAARMKKIDDESKTTLLGDAMNFPFPDICDAWGNPDLGDSFRKNPASRVQTLFISGTLDVRTPPSNAEEVRKGFKNSVHLIIDGAVHSDPLFLSSPKIKDVMLEFMKGGKISTTQITLEPLKFMQIAPPLGNP